MKKINTVEDLFDQEETHSHKLNEGLSEIGHTSFRGRTTQPTQATTPPTNEIDVVTTQVQTTPTYNRRLQVFDLLIRVPGATYIVGIGFGIVVSILIIIGFIGFAKPLLRQMGLSSFKWPAIHISNPFVNSTYNFTSLYFVGLVMLALVAGAILYGVYKIIQGILRWRNTRWIANDHVVIYKVKGVPFFLDSVETPLLVSTIDTVTIRKGKVMNTLFHYGTVDISIIDRPGTADDVFDFIPFMKYPEQFVAAIGKFPTN
jgi:hypothetical protein